MRGGKNCARRSISCLLIVGSRLTGMGITMRGGNKVKFANRVKRSGLESGELWFFCRSAGEQREGAKEERKGGQACWAKDQGHGGTWRGRGPPIPIHPWWRTSLYSHVWRPGHRPPLHSDPN